MENSDVFIRTLVRAFYDAEHVIIIDTLLRHEILSLTELQALVAAPEERSLSEQCARLQRSGLVRITESSEKRDRYVFVDRRQAIHTASSTLRKMQDQISQIDAVSPAAITYESSMIVSLWYCITPLHIRLNFLRDTFCQQCIQYFFPYDITKISSTQLYMKYKREKGWTSPVHAREFPLDVLFDYKVIVIPRRHFHSSEKGGSMQLITRAKPVYQAGTEDALGCVQGVGRPQHVPRVSVPAAHLNTKALPPIPKQEKRHKALWSLIKFDRLR
ncbi:hypothetical protein CGGC5_v017082 [Colletotrichum fructicola Nara gc5]|uniref:Uncharacterized protein n=1 Tax=Colletotrichum fructicola (strain Nara gc5) TaxID=1213859 RepID=A0A7J6ICF8_COLFN|nr:hypothetical protein CGGC5_v017082 [Colletotrichum fructicola Nara gc5]